MNEHSKSLLDKVKSEVDRKIGVVSRRWLEACLLLVSFTAVTGLTLGLLLSGTTLFWAYVIAGLPLATAIAIKSVEIFRKRKGGK